MIILAKMDEARRSKQKQQAKEKATHSISRSDRAGQEDTARGAVTPAKRKRVSKGSFDRKLQVYTLLATLIGTLAGTGATVAAAYINQPKSQDSALAQRLVALELREYQREIAETRAKIDALKEELQKLKETEVVQREEKKQAIQEQENRLRERQNSVKPNSMSTRLALLEHLPPWSAVVSMGPNNKYVLILLNLLPFLLFPVAFYWVARPLIRRILNTRYAMES